MTTENVFLTKAEYQEDINNIFLKFTFGDENYIDLNIMEQIFIALEKPLSPATIKKLQTEIQKENMPGVPYERFEEIYLQLFPYNSIDLMNEAFNIFDEKHVGKITFADMKRVAESLSLKFTDEELKDMIHVFDETDTAISYDTVKNSYV